MAADQRDNPTGNNRPSDEELQPWIEVIQTAETPALFRPAEPAGRESSFQAIFGASVRPLSFKKRATRQWGFNREALHMEALGRQAQFLAGLRGPDEIRGRELAWAPTIALQCNSAPAYGELQLFLLGKVRGVDEGSARQRALEFWHMLRALFPYDYRVRPLPTREAFLDGAGYTMLKGLNDPACLLELHRYQLHLASNDGPLFLSGAWASQIRGDEPIWRALAAAGQPAFLRVTVRPAYLQEAEWLALRELTGALGRQVETIPQAFLGRECNWAGSLFQERLRDWRQPYLVQVHLAGKGSTLDLLAQTVGVAMTRGGDEGADRPGYQIRRPANEGELAMWLANLGALDFSDSAGKQADRRLARFPYLAGLQEAAVALRWPFPPEKTWPDVHFL